MWQVYAQVAHDLIAERQREAAALSLARSNATPGESDRPAPAPSPSALRGAVAGALRGVGGVASAVSRRAGAAAARLEGRTA